MNTEKLSFVARSGDGKLSLWNPDRSGSYDEQWQRGIRYGNELAHYIREYESDMILMQVIRHMDTAKLYDPVEGGFLTFLSTAFAASLV